MKGMMIVTVLLLSAVAGQALAESAGATSADASDPIQEGFNLSFNNSSIYYGATTTISAEPVSIAAGNGYYATHPIGYSSQIGSRTSIKNGQVATSMQQEINYAQGISGALELNAGESSLLLGDYYVQHVQQSGFTSMIINEDVIEGQVHIGVFQGEIDQSSDTGMSTPTMASAWKSPSLEMEEDYVGTYHIEKNMSINVPYASDRRFYGWLDCCGKIYADMSHFERSALNADRVFNCNLIEGYR